MAKSNMDVNVIILLKCFIFLFGLFSVITPWLIAPNFFEMNVLGMIKYPNQEYSSPGDLFTLCGVLYLIGIVSNLFFYERKKGYTYSMGYLSLFSAIFGILGYSILGMTLITYAALEYRHDYFNIYFGMGYYFGLIVVLSIIIEVLYIRLKADK